MFQLIILAQLKDGADPAPLMEFLGTELPRQVPTVRRSDVRADLGLTKDLGHNATFSWIVDFEDQAGWQVYRDSDAHETFKGLLFPVAEQYLATQTLTDDRG